MPTSASRSVNVQAVHPASTPSFIAPDDWQTFGDLVVEESEPTWWIVDIDTAECWVDNSAGTVLAPDPRSPSSSPTSRSALFGDLTWTNETGKTLTFDLGTNQRLCAFGRKVTFKVRAPRPSQTFVVGGPLMTDAAVSVTQVNISAYPTCYAPIGGRDGRLSLRQRILNTEQPIVQIPAGVTEVQIFEHPDVGAPVSALWQYLDRDNQPSGSVPLFSGASQVNLVPGPARALRLAAAAGRDLTYTLAFRLLW